MPQSTWYVYSPFKKIMRIILVLCLTVMAVLTGCSSSTDTTDTTVVPSKASAFIFSGAVGTTYTYKTTTIHYGDIEKDTSYSRNRYTIKNRNATLSNGKSAIEVELVQENGLSERLFFSSTDATLYAYRYLSGTTNLLEELLLMTPFTNGATFSRGGNLPEPLVKISNVRASVKVPKGTYTTIQAVHAYTANLGSIKQDYNSTWYFSSGTMWAKRIVTQTLTPLGGNPSLNVEIEELESVK